MIDRRPEEIARIDQRLETATVWQARKLREQRERLFAELAEEERVFRRVAQGWAYQPPCLG